MWLKRSRRQRPCCSRTRPCLFGVCCEERRGLQSWRWLLLLLILGLHVFSFDSCRRALLQPAPGGRHVKCVCAWESCTKLLRRERERESAIWHRFLTWTGTYHLDGSFWWEISRFDGGDAASFSLISEGTRPAMLAPSAAPANTLASCK